MRSTQGILGCVAVLALTMGLLVFWTLEAAVRVLMPVLVWFAMVGR